MVLTTPYSSARYREYWRHITNSDEVSHLAYLAITSHCFVHCSGQGRSVLEALEVMKSLYRTTKRLIEDEPWGLAILPGSGINPGNIGAILDTLLPLGLQELHLSGGGWVEGGMLYRRENMGMGVGGHGDWRVWTTDEQKIREVREIADARWDSYVTSMQVERSGSDS